MQFTDKFCLIGPCLTVGVIGRLFLTSVVILSCQRLLTSLLYLAINEKI